MIASYLPATVPVLGTGANGGLPAPLVLRFLSLLCHEGEDRGTSSLRSPCSPPLSILPIHCVLQLADLIRISPCVMDIIPTKEELKEMSYKEEKTPLWAPPPQHNFLKNWQRNLALRKKQQEVLSGEQRVRLPPDRGGCESHQAFFPSHIHPELGANRPHRRSSLPNAACSEAPRKLESIQCVGLPGPSYT